MSGGDYFYEGADYGFDPEYGRVSQAYSSNPAEGIGLATDARTANQLKAVSEKLNTGARAIEVSGVSPDVFESIPREHFKELDRLRKIVGNNVELTLHGPVIEPTGLTKRGWDASEREQSERQMIGAVEKAHDLNPEGNVVATFHASAVSLPGEVKVWEEKEGKKVPVIKEIYIIDERSGALDKISLKPSYLEGKEVVPEEELNKLNKSNWYKNLQHLNYAAEHGATIVENAIKNIPEMPDLQKDLLHLYKIYAEGKSEEAENELKKVEEKYPEHEGIGYKFRDMMQTTLHGDIYLKDAYNGLREMFEQAYSSLKESDNPNAKEEIGKLDAFRKRIAPKLKDIENPEKVHELAEEIRNGVHLLRSIETPQIFKPFKQFAINKSSDTFSNVALDSYRKFGDSSPIISIENPPAGAFAIYNGEDLKALVDESRKKFADKAVEKLGMSREQARKEAEKLIGATWDMGHINMLRKFGAGEKELKEETRAVAPVVKHVHLSDNFGLEHTEIPMGMGNVPTKEMMKLITDYNKKVKKIIEAGTWYQHFQTTPFAETLQHFESPIYAMKNASYFGPHGGYFAGYGMNPEVHHAMFGAGFANLPVELGGQMSGRSRVTGAPME